MQRIFLGMFLASLAFHLIQAQEPDLGSEAQRQAGRKIYMQKCAQCHGEKGDGNGIARSFFRPAPRDFTAAIFKIRTTESGELPTDEDLKNIIKKGMPYTGMPAWPDFTDEELSNLVYYLKTFSEDFAGPYGVVEPIKIPRAPTYSEESARKGRQVYEANQCFDCHGRRGRGDGKSAPTLKDHWGEPIRPADLTKRWTFRGGPAREDIYRTFTTGMDGTPMPSYSIDPEQRWQLVDYVYSLSKDTPEYATVVVARGIEGEIDLRKGAQLFQDAREALFPVVGQVIEPGREFFPGVNAVAVKAVYNTEDIAILITWHDMSAERTGRNSLALAVPRLVAGTEQQAGVDSSEKTFSDAVAVQIPAENPEGFVKPYFLLGDRKRAVDIWFLDLAKKKPELFIGRGSQNIQPATGELMGTANYEDGKWMVLFKRKRLLEKGLSFEIGNFVPIAFSVWDGWNEERGNKRGITSWYYLYLEPLKKVSPVVPMVKYGLLTFLFEMGLIYGVRRKHKVRST